MISGGKKLLIGLFAVAGSIAATSANAAIIITEVQPSSSGNSPYTADWFELTNNGASAVNIAGWKVDDSSNLFASAVTLRGITSVNPGESVVFLEGTSDGSTDASIGSAFRTAWGLSGTPQLGFYGGSQIGLSTGGDAVNIFNAAGANQASVSFGSAPGSSPYATFDNAAGATGAISLLSVVGTNGAYLAPGRIVGQGEIGSPGSIAAPVPLPAAAWLLLSGAGALGAFARRRRAQS